jgi:hypothetical protein
LIHRNGWVGMERKTNLTLEKTRFDQRFEKNQISTGNVFLVNQPKWYFRTPVNFF